MDEIYKTMYAIHQTSKDHNHSHVSLGRLEIYKKCQQ